MRRREFIQGLKLSLIALPALGQNHQPSKVSIAINLQIARRLGISIPQSLLIRADEVIE